MVVGERSRGVETTKPVVVRESAWRYSGLGEFQSDLVAPNLDNKKQISRTGREVGRSPTDPALVLTVVDPRRGPRKCQKGDTEPTTPPGPAGHRISARPAPPPGNVYDCRGPVEPVRHKHPRLLLFTLGTPQEPRFRTGIHAVDARQPVAVWTVRPIASLRKNFQQAHVAQQLDSFSDVPFA